MKSDIEIARSCNMKRIEEVAATAGIPAEVLEHYGKYMAKIPLSLIDEERVACNRLILVSSISPTRAGIGKTTVSIGLSMALNRIGKRSMLALREPSLGPCFGMKGGAAGGGYAQVVPMEKINLHFTGDFHAITSAHNMIAALLDNYIFQHRSEGFALKQILWKRVLDVNDRSLRNIVTGLGNTTDGLPAQSGFDITPASEIMAALCLADSEDDLRRRIENMVLGITFEDKPFTVCDLGVAGAITVLLMDALKPNLVQTLEGTPALVHGGPFANIAHGCNSLVATKIAMSLSDYAVTEAGFGADLGAEKFLDIKCRKAGIHPRITVLVTTLRGLKMHGGLVGGESHEQERQALIEGFANLDRHVKNMQRFGQPVVVTLNRYGDDSEEEIALLSEHCRMLGVGFAENNVFVQGGEGAEELARLVVETIDRQGAKEIRMAYADDDTIEEKVNRIAKNIYGARSVILKKSAEKKLARIRAWGMERFPVCIAKTQFSFSEDPKQVGAAKDFDITIRDFVINGGAEMIVAIAGDIMRMPGLPKIPQAEKIDIVHGQIEGLA
ncbi:MAG: formate--tetrahydrofolate ligase [Prevotella multiformis]|uniref:formate--tetrahydrofolate ligase n=1 Tax=Prevotella multiformis TaxID=282402 RepID=UPI003FA0A747